MFERAQLFDNAIRAQLFDNAITCFQRSQDTGL